MDINNKLFLLKHRKAILHELIRIAHEQKDKSFINTLLSKLIKNRYKNWNYQEMINLILEYYKNEYKLSSKKANQKLNILVGDLLEIDNIF